MRTNEKWEESFRICLSVMFGGLIGYLLMDKMATSYELGRYFIWAGLLGGCVVGAVSYRFGQITTAFRQTWQKVVAWRFNYAWWVAIGILANVFLTIVVGCFLFAFFICLGMYSWFDLMFGEGSAPILIQAFGASVTMTIVIAIMVILYLFSKVGKLDNYPDRKDVVKNNWEPRVYNPLTIPGYLLLWSARVIISELEKLWHWLREDSRRQVVGATILTASFCWQVFILIHSRARTIVFIDSGVAALLAYGLDYNLIGLLVALLLGGLWGVINYQLVAMWWLKLEPAPARN